MSKIILQRVLGNQVAIKRVENAKEIAGFLMPNSNEEPIIGQIILLGEGEKNKDGVLNPIDSVKIGDHVVFKKWGGTAIKTEDGELLILAISDIMGVVSIK